jgi:hypothetical protein
MLSVTWQHQEVAVSRFLPVALLALAGSALAEEQARHEGYAPLEHLVGTWTIVGKEDSYRETCGWYHGKRHIVCETESKRKDGSISHGMSILSFVPESGYVYTGIGSSGRYESYRGGTYNEGVLEYVNRTPAEITRIRVGPFTGKGEIPFAVHTSTDGAAWTLAESFSYRRAK